MTLSAKLWSKFVNLNRGPFLLTKAYFQVLHNKKLISFIKRSTVFKIEKMRGEDCLAIWKGKDQSSIWGILKVNKNRCILECLSRNKAEKGKNFLERHLGQAINFKAYSLEQVGDKKLSENKTQEQCLSLKEYLQYYYEKEWINTPLAFLDGKTPLEASKRPQSRKRLLALINRIEKTSKLPYDFNRLRCLLKLGCIYELKEKLEQYKLALQEEILVFLDASFRLLKAMEEVGIGSSLNSEALIRTNQLVDELTEFVVKIDETSCFREFKTLKNQILARFEEIEDNLLTFLDSLPKQDEIISLFSDESWDHHSKKVSEPFLLPLPRIIARELMANWRESAEEIGIEPNMDLQTLLQKQPIEWIEAISHFLKIKNHSSKKHKYIKQIVSFLHNSEQLKEIIKGLDTEAKRLLRLVLDTGGTFPYACLVECFGNDAQDGFYWKEKPPQSVIGILRARGLLFVGYVKSTNKKIKVAVIPSDLRKKLSQTLKNI